MNTMSGQPAPESATRSNVLKFGLPALLVAGVALSVPLVLGGGDTESISTADVSTTTIAPLTASTTAADAGADTNNDVFTETEATAEDVAIATTVPETTSTVAPTTSVAPTTVPLTVPDTLPEQPAAPIAPPADPRAPEDQIQLGGISIPKLGVDAPLLEGIRLTTLDNGPGHWPGTAMPGEVGNVVVAAHRTSHGGPFRNIDQLVAGDSVLFNTAGVETEYLVTGTEIVEPNAIWIVDPTDTPTATLFACHPPGSVRQRIVVYLELAA